MDTNNTASETVIVEKTLDQPLKTEEVLSNFDKKVTETLISSNSKVTDRVVDLLVEQELASRVLILQKALKKRPELSGKVKSSEKGDIETYNLDGSVAASTFSKPKLEEHKKAKKDLAEFDAALNLALEKADWKSLKKIVDSKSDGAAQ